MLFTIDPALEPSTRLSSAAVDVTVVLAIDNASVSRVPSISALPLISKEAPSISPLAVTVVKVPAAALAPPITVPSIVPPSMLTEEKDRSAVTSTIAAPEPAPSA